MPRKTAFDPVDCASSSSRWPGWPQSHGAKTVSQPEPRRLSLDVTRDATCWGSPSVPVMGQLRVLCRAVMGRIAREQQGGGRAKA